VLDEHLELIDDGTMGAECTFVGRVRDHDPDAAGTVIGLEYSSHPDAQATLQRLAEEAIGDTDAIVAVSHRVGRLAVGDAAVVICVAAAHRGDAFTVCRALLESIKHGLPIWKRQGEADGTTSWKGLGG
jgi:molybdopterin synthase catalytic subunit